MVVYALLPTHVLALLAGLDQFVMKVRLIVSVVLCYSTYIAMSIMHNGISDILLFLCLIRTIIFSLNERLCISVHVLQVFHYSNLFVGVRLICISL